MLEKYFASVSLFKFNVNWTTTSNFILAHVRECDSFDFILN